jgi:2-C-methyl-D-erythritol 2,4-cyclodiphosphate synthase
MMRVGIGYDVHRFTRRRPLRLGGVTIPFAKGLAGHSDADVLLHALADALFGAVGAPDLGEQFPPGDPRYRSADSRLFIAKACAMVRRRGWRVGNIDATVIADAPKLAAHKGRMRRRIGDLLGIDPDRVCVKAKTTEGFSPGRGGIAAHAVVLLKHIGGARPKRSLRRPHTR